MAQGRYNEPFFWHRIVNVGWAGGVVVVEAEYLLGVTFISVDVISPPDIVTSTDSGLTEILASDYQNDVAWYAKKVGQFETIQVGVVLEDDITDIWIWDAFLINGLGDDSGVAEGDALYGPFKLHYAGMQVAHDTAHFGRPLLGDYVEYTHPNGHVVTYANGATPLSEAYIQWQAPPESGGTLYTGVVIRTNDPNGIPPAQDLSGTESWYWYHLGSAAGSNTDKIRQSWLVYFKNDRALQAALFLAGAVPVTLPDGIVNYNIRGYPDGTEFDISAGHIVPKSLGTLAKWEASGSVPLGETALITFGPSGLTSA